MCTAADACGVSVRTAYKWLPRFRADGAGGLQDRSSRPQRCRHASTPRERERFVASRCQRWPLWRIALAGGRSPATLSRCIKRAGLSRLDSLELSQPVALRALGAGRAAAPRHQVARPHRRRGPPHHRAAPAPQPRHRLGCGAPGGGQSLARLLRPCRARQARRQLHRLPAPGRGPLRRLARAHRPRHDGQRLRLRCDATALRALRMVAACRSVAFHAS